MFRPSRRTNPSEPTSTHLNTQQQGSVQLQPSSEQLTVQTLLTPSLSKEVQGLICIHIIKCLPNNAFVLYLSGLGDHDKGRIVSWLQWLPDERDWV